MRRMSMVAAALAALALGVASADGAIKKGSFAGKTNENDPFGFKVRKHKVTHVYMEGVKLYCDDGSTRTTPSGSHRFDIPLHYKISKSRRFTIKAFNSTTGDEVHGKGRFNKKG